MSISKKCFFFREYGAPKNNCLRGYCDLNGEWTTCRGDVFSCKRNDLLRKYLLEEKRKEGGSGW
jgi:hypothetical protein